MELTKKQWLFIGLGTTSLAFLFHILTHAVQRWGTESSRYSSSVTDIVGLWSECLVSGSDSVCVSLTCDELSTSKCTVLMFARAFWMVTTIVCAITVIAFILKLIPNLELNQRLSNSLLNIPAGCVLTGILGIILGFVFVLQDTTFSVGVCAILAIFAYILQLIAVFIARRIKKAEYISY